MKIFYVQLVERNRNLLIKSRNDLCLERNINIHGYNWSEYACVSWSSAPAVAMCAAGQDEVWAFFFSYFFLQNNQL